MVLNNYLNKTSISKYITIFFLFGSLVFVSCYSFTGASIPPHLKRIYIPNFQDKSNSGVSNLKEDLTRKLTDKIISQSSLELGSNQSADCVLEGNIAVYSNQPFVVAAKSTSNTNRITLKVKVTYRDLVKKETIWETTFDNWGEYTIGSTSAESDALADAMNKITDDIFTKVVSSW